MTKLTTDQIDNYHAGKMSETEMSDFENAVNSDPAAKAESDFQADIVNGLKEYRKIELKARLDAINVGPTWFEFVQQSALMKSLGGVMLASLIGTGIFLYGERPENENSDMPATVIADQTESIEFVWELGNEKESNTENQLDKPSQALSVKEKNKDFDRVVLSENEEVALETVNEDSDLNAVSESKVFKPVFEVPDAESVNDEQLETTGLDELPASTKAAGSEVPVDVRSDISRSKSIKYKYFDGKLYLKGDFDKAPYEILEINSSAGRRIYVYYLDKYYKVGISDKLTDLPEVTDDKVIDELKLLRANK